MKTFSGNIDNLPENGILVFGANTQGRHGKGVALIAAKTYGAIYGQAKGLQGKSYAIITKDLTKRKHPSIPDYHIISDIIDLYVIARNMPDNDFYIPYKAHTENLNAYTPQEMALMFYSAGELLGEGIPNNIVFEERFTILVMNCRT
jgi:hypothetical protein